MCSGVSSDGASAHDSFTVGRPLIATGQVLGLTVAACTRRSSRQSWPYYVAMFRVLSELFRVLSELAAMRRPYRTPRGRACVEMCQPIGRASGQQDYIASTDTSNQSGPQTRRRRDSLSEWDGRYSGSS